MRPRYQRQGDRARKSYLGIEGFLYTTDKGETQYVVLSLETVEMTQSVWAIETLWMETVECFYLNIQMGCSQFKRPKTRGEYEECVGVGNVYQVIMIYFLHRVQRPGPSLIITPDKNIIAVLIYHLLTPPGTLYTTNINAITETCPSKPILTGS